MNISKIKDMLDDDVHYQIVARIWGVNITPIGINQGFNGFPTIAYEVSTDTEKVTIHVRKH